MHFIINNDSKMGQRYWKFKENQKKFFEFTKRFLDDNGLETKEYGIWPYLTIVPTEKDIEKYGKQMKTPVKAGSMVHFRKNCKLQKLWREGLKENSIDTDLIDRRDVILPYTPWRGGFTWNLFDIDGVIYFLYQSNLKDDDLKDFPEPDFKEIKASEYYKVIEEHEAKKAAEKSDD